MAKARLLSKSRFKVGHECPAKLAYVGKVEYGSTKVDNKFLQALAEGGFQVGELAKLYFPGGIEISTLDQERAISETKSALAQKKVIVYEAAARADNFLIRADIVIKNGANVELIEVKAKSIDPTEDDPFYNKRARNGMKTIKSKWEPYIADVAFQCFVLQKAFPDFKITCSLLLADKTAEASVDGLNQKFFLVNDTASTRRVVVDPDVTTDGLGTKLLKKISVDDEVSHILNLEYLDKLSFPEYVRRLADAYSKDQKLSALPAQQCKSCEFRITDDLKARGLKSGFEECWTQERNLKSDDFKRPFVFDLWNFRRAESLIAQGCLFIDQLHEEDFSAKSEDGDESGLSSRRRQWLQAEKVINNDKTPYLDVAGLRQEMNSWKFPLHFIDFETTMVAIPFHKGRRPYEQIAFQFSHHVVEKSGAVAHRTEYINCTQGKFPNFDFVRNLRDALSGDNGSIFRFAAHENTVLCQILNQLHNSTEADSEELISWIRTVTKAPEKASEKWEGQRSMIDMRELVLKYFYHPATDGSNSIKDVLPAILQESQFLQSKYSSPIYGSKGGIASKNYSDWSWIRIDKNGRVADPYSLLEPLFDGVSCNDLDGIINLLDEEHRIADGGAAMMAYARMQFTQMSNIERERVIKALLKYCELDTFAMVLIYEYWKHEIENSAQKVA